VAGAKALAAKGIKAAALPADLGDPASVKAMIAKVRAALRPITVVQWNAMGVSIANSAKHELVGLLAEKLKADNVYVGEVVVMGAAKGTAFDNGTATLEAKTIAAKFRVIYTARSETSVNLG